MEVLIVSRNVEVPEALRAATQEKISRLARYLDGVHQAEVHFSEEKNPRIHDREVCEVTLQGPRRAIRAKAASPDAFTAVDKVVGKLEHQMTKLKGKRIGRSHPRRAPSVDFVTEATEPDEEPEGGRVRIVETKRAPVKPMTPEEAALQLEVRGNGFLLFTNAENQRAAVVYRRADGAFGLVETA